MFHHLWTALSYGLGHWHSLLTSLFGLLFLVYFPVSPALESAPGWYVLLQGYTCWMIYIYFMQRHHAPSGWIPTPGWFSPHPKLPMTLRARAVSEALAYVCRLFVGGIPLLVLVSWPYDARDGALLVSVLAFLLPLALCARLRVNSATPQSQSKLPFVAHVLGESLGWFGLYHGLVQIMGGGLWVSLLVSSLAFLAVLAWGRPVLHLPPMRFGFKGPE